MRKPYGRRLAQADEFERARQLPHEALAVTVPEAIEAGLALNLPSAMTRSEGETVLGKYQAFFAELERYHLESRDRRIGFVAGALKCYNIRRLDVFLRQPVIPPLFFDFTFLTEMEIPCLRVHSILFPSRSIRFTTKSFAASTRSPRAIGQSAMKK